MSKLVRYESRPLTRWERLSESLRSYWRGPILSSDPAVADFFGTGTTTATGLRVTESTALTYSAVWSAVLLISSQIGNLPLVFYRKLDSGGKEKWEKHPLYRLIHERSNPESSAYIFRQTLQGHVLTWGNGYAEIVRNRAGMPAALWPLTPDRVTPFRQSADAPLQYRVVNNGGGDTIFDASDILHIPGLGYDGTCGYSVISKMRESIGLGLASEKFGATFYGNGATFGGVISYAGAKPTDLAQKGSREDLENRHVGVERAHKFLMLYNGAKYDRLGIPPNDAQFLETRTFQVDEVARWFNLPPHKLKELMRSTNNNIEHQNLEYYIDCLSPWLTAWEQELREKLISPLERSQQHIEFVTTGLLRGDNATRGTYQGQQFNIGALTPNDIRSLENRNPVPGGDLAFVPLNTIPVQLVEEYYRAEIEAKQAKAAADRRPPPDPQAPNPQQTEQINSLNRELELARKKAQDEEDAKDRIEAEMVAVRLALRDAETARDTAVAQTGDLEARIQATTSLAADVQFWTLKAQALEQERDGLKAEAEKVPVLTADLGQSREETERSRNEHEQTKVQLGAAVADGAEKTQQVLALQDQILETQIALRAVLVDAVARLIAKETDRARKAAGTPEKLRRWVTDFYPAHADTCRTNLRPAMKAWLLASGSDQAVDGAIEVLVPGFVEESTRTIAGVLVDATPETLAPALEVVLRRWEAARAEATVERLIKGVA